MLYREPLFRPPSEAESYILQITYGCSHNKCAFCGMYKNKKFLLRPMDEIIKDIEIVGKVFPQTRRVFLADGDAFVMETDRLIKILECLNKTFPLLQRAGIYVNPGGVQKKSEEELKSLKKMKLSIGYLGLESGHEEILRSVNKEFTAEDMIECVIKAQKCGIKMSVIILLGIAGVEYSEEHAIKTAEALNRMQPKFLSALTLMLVPGTPLFEKEKKGKFLLPDSSGMLRELKMIIEHLKLESTIFRSNHASNYLPLEGRFPKDKELLLARLDYAIKNINQERLLKPEFLRGL